MAMRPDVDVGAQTAAVPAPVPDVAIASAAPLPGPGLAPADPVLAPAEQTLDDQAAMLTPAPPLAPAAEPLLDTGPEEPVPDLVPEDAPIEVAPPPALPEPRAPARRQTLAPEKPTLAAYPRFQVPDLARPQAMPGDEVDCRRELKRLRVKFSDLPPIREGGVRHRPPGQGLGHRQRRHEARRDALLRHGAHLRAVDQERTRPVRPPSLFQRRQDHPPGVELFLPQDRRQPRRALRAWQGQRARHHAHRAEQRPATST